MALNEYERRLTDLRQDVGAFMNRLEMLGVGNLDAARRALEKYADEAREVQEESREELDHDESLRIATLSQILLQDIAEHMDSLDNKSAKSAPGAHGVYR